MRVPPVIGEKWQVWAEDLRKYLGKAGSQLAAKEDSSSAKEDGIILWDRVNQEPVVSVSGAWVALGGGSGVSDGDKGDITVSGSGANWIIDAGAVTLAKMADMATDSFLGRDTAGAGAPEVLSPATAKTILAIVSADVSDLATTVQAYTLDTFANPVASMDFAQQQTLQFVIENRTSDPGSPVSGQLWLRTDL